MPHYICVGGCEGVSEEPGVCQAENCLEHGNQLKECDCNDGKHYGAFEDAATPPEKSEEESAG